MLMKFGHSSWNQLNSCVLGCIQTKPGVAAISAGLPDSVATLEEYRCLVGELGSMILFQPQTTA